MSQPEFKARIVLEAEVSPSEDSAKVRAALENVVGGAQSSVTIETSSARLVTEDPRALLYIRDKLRDRHVRGAARRRLLLNMKRSSTSMLLNRQAAAAGVVAVCGAPEESPLGPIHMSIHADGIEAAIDWLAAYEEG